MTDNISSIIENIDRLISEGAKFNQFVPLVEKLIALGPRSIASIHLPGTGVYRATTHHTELPTRIEELWYPPVEKASLGRANRKGDPVFYCSSDPNGAFMEVGSEIGRLVVLAKWVTILPMLLHDLGYSKQVLLRAGSRRKLLKHHKSFYKSSLDKKGRFIRDYFALAFTEPTSEKYELTTAIAEVHLRADELSGLLYPAVSKAANVDNLAIRPIFVHKGLKLETAQLVKVDEIREGGYVGGIILCDVTHVEPNGALHWKFRSESVAVPPGGKYVLQPGTSFPFHSPGEYEIDGKRYKVETGYWIEVGELDVVVRDLRGNIVEPVRVDELPQMRNYP